MGEMAANIAALGAAFFWALGSLLATTPVQQLKPVVFNRIRMPMVFVMLSIFLVFNQGWNSIRAEDYWLLILSAVVGIFLGDTAYFKTIYQLGPRRASILFSTYAPLSAILGYFFLGEELSLKAILGCLLVMLGVALAIAFGNRKQQDVDQWEEIKGSLLVGVILGLIAGLCQAVGAIIVKPALVAGADPVASSSIRVGVAAILLMATALFPKKTKETPLLQISKSIYILIALSGLIGMGVAVSLMLYALAHGSTGVVMTLASTTPAMVLPLIWFKTRKAPQLGAWGGVLLVVLGSALIF